MAWTSGALALSCTSALCVATRNVPSSADFMSLGMHNLYAGDPPPTSHSEAASAVLRAALCYHKQGTLATGQDYRISPTD